MKYLDMVTIFAVARMLLSKGYSADHMARDENDRPCGPFSSDARKFSVTGSLIRAKYDVIKAGFGQGTEIFAEFDRVHGLGAHDTISDWVADKSQRDAIKAIDDCLWAIMGRAIVVGKTVDSIVDQW